MKCDLIMIGAGSGGLMAAKTVAEDRLRVVLVKRKRNFICYKLTRYEKHQPKIFLQH